MQVFQGKKPTENKNLTEEQLWKAGAYAVCLNKAECSILTAPAIATASWEDQAVQRPRLGLKPSMLEVPSSIVQH